MTIAARVAYAAPTLPDTYNGSAIRAQLARLSQSVSPMITRAVLSNTTVLATDDTLVCDATGGAITVTLPPADQVQYLRVSIKRINGGGNAVTLGGTVDGSVNPTLGSQWSSITIQSDGTRWLTLATV